MMNDLISIRNKIESGLEGYDLEGKCISITVGRGSFYAELKVMLHDLRENTYTSYTLSTHPELSRILTIREDEETQSSELPFQVVLMELDNKLREWGVKYGE